jgi:acyl carrier protein
MEKNELRRIAAKSLEIDETLIQDSSNLEDLGWDSLVQLSFISDLDSTYSVRVDALALSAVETFHDLFLLLESE